MSKITCSVSSCVYNKGRVCSAHVLNIGGRDSRITETTFCETYSKGGGYSNLAGYEDNENAPGQTDTVLCSVNTCAYHAKDHCNLGDIEVGALKDVNDYMETDCLSFERK